jgi:hypothetical protein
MLGYGYQSRRALLHLAAVLLVSVTLAVGLGQRGALAAPGDAAKTHGPTSSQPPARDRVHDTTIEKQDTVEATRGDCEALRCNGLRAEPVVTRNSGHERQQISHT